MRAPPGSLATTRCDIHCVCHLAILLHVVEGNDMRLAGREHLAKCLLKLIVRRIIRPQGKGASGMEVRCKARETIEGVERCMARMQDVLRRVVDINQDRVVAAPWMVGIETRL